MWDAATGTTSAALCRKAGAATPSALTCPPACCAHWRTCASPAAYRWFRPLARQRSHNDRRHRPSAGRIRLAGTRRITGITGPSQQRGGLPLCGDLGVVCERSGLDRVCGVSRMRFVVRGCVARAVLRGTCSIAATSAAAGRQRDGVGAPQSGDANEVRAPRTPSRRGLCAPDPLARHGAGNRTPAHRKLDLLWNAYLRRPVLRNAEMLRTIRPPQQHVRARWLCAPGQARTRGCRPCVGPELSRGLSSR